MSHFDEDHLQEPLSPHNRPVDSDSSDDMGGHGRKVSISSSSSSDSDSGID
jgi:hypothetical protein